MSTSAPITTSLPISTKMSILISMSTWVSISASTLEVLCPDQIVLIIYGVRTKPILSFWRSVIEEKRRRGEKKNCWHSLFVSYFMFIVRLLYSDSLAKLYWTPLCNVLNVDTSTDDLHLSRSYRIEQSRGDSQD